MKKKTNFNLGSTNVSWKYLYQLYSEKLTKNIQQLKIILKRWADLKKTVIQIPHSEEDLLLNYLKIKNNYNNSTRLEENYNRFQLHYENIDRPQTEDDVYINYPLIGKQKWNLIVEEQFFSQNYKSLKHIFTKIFIYTQGFIPTNQKCQGNYLKLIKKSRFNKSSYYEQVQSKQPLVLNIGFQKLPSFQLNSKKILFFQFVPYIALIRKSKYQQKNNSLIKSIEQLWKKDPRKNLSEMLLIQDKEKLNPKLHYFQTKQCIDLESKILEKSPIVYKISKQSPEDYIFKLKNLFSNNYQNEQIYSQNQERENLQKQQEKYQVLNLQQQCDQKEIQKNHYQANLISFKNAKELINLLQKIPNFKFNLTEQQKDVVGKDGNVIVVGRSGTGKTTCALVRLFAIQILYKQNAFKLKIKNKEIQKKNFQPSDIEEIFGLNNVFLTASSTLIVQIKKQYEDMIDHLKQQLKLHNLKKQQKQNQIKDGQNILKELQKMNKPKKDIQNIAKNQKQQQKKLISLKYLEGKDFPAFFTIKNFVIMIDGVLQKPFFTRFQHQNIIQKQQNQQEQLGWNQQKQESSKIKIQARRVSAQKNKKYKKLTQLTFDSFIQQFWSDLPKVFLSEADLSPPIVWSQIYSIIKGSVLAHSFKCKYLSENQYLKHSINKFYVTQDKKAIYKIFQYYEQWKTSTNHYDFMDVVNNCLFEIKTKGYNGPPINYLFIDQVQDLTPATIYLLSKIVTNAVFYSGDTAQAIVKGVSFRFADIKTMYHQKFQLQKLPHGWPNETQLTVNFRSHNQILQLANTIVSSIEILFPKTIDSLKKQTSSLPCPKPFIMNSKQQFDKFKLLCLPQQVSQFQDELRYRSERSKTNSSNSKRTIFSSQQIIIVRNLQQKQNLPQILKLGIVLTIQEAKGLQFQDVILYNFFQSCKCRDKWKLVQYLFLEEQLVEKSQYQNSINRVQEILNLQAQAIDIELQKCKIGKNEYYKIKKIKLDPKIQEVDKNKYIQLLTELKIIYTIITRAKISFVIFDSKIPQYLLKIWKQLKVVQTINNLLSENQKLLFYKQKFKTKRFVNQQQQWRNQGYKLYMRKNYDEAIKCYQMANDPETAKKIKAQKIANTALIQFKRYNNQLQNPRKLDSDQFAILVMNLQIEKKLILDKFQQAGKLFYQIQNFKNAGQCFISAQNYKEALYCFQKCKFLQGIALSCLKTEKYQLAAYNYQKLQRLQKMLQCYQAGSLWNEGLFKFFQYQNFIENPQLKCRLFTKNFLKDLLKNFKSKKFKNKPYNQEIKNVYIARDFKDKIKQFICQFTNVKYTTKVQQMIKEMQDIEQKVILHKKIDKIMNQKMQQIIKIEIFHKSKFTQKLQEFTQKLQALKEDYANLSEMQQILKNNIRKFNQKHQSLQKCKDKTEKLIQYIEHFQNLIKTKEQIQENPKIQSLRMRKDNRNIDTYQKQYSEMSIQDAKLRYSEFQFEQNNSQFQLEEDYQNQSDDEKPFEEQFDDDILSVYSFCDTQYQQDNQSFESIFKQKIMEESSKRELLKKCHQLVEKTFKYLTNPNKLTMNQQHPLYIIRRNQSECIKNNQATRQYFQMIEKIQNIGQYQICLFLTDFFWVNENAWKYILSHCLQFCSHYRKGFKVFKAKNNVNFKKQSSASVIIGQFLNILSIDCFKRQIQSTLLFKQPQINTICQGLILQGAYKNTLQFLNDEQYCNLTYRFSNYHKFMQKIKTTEQYQHLKYDYIIVQQTNRKNLLAKLVNVVSLQQIFWIYDSLQKTPFLSKTNWQASVQLSEQDKKQITKKIKQFTKQIYQKIQSIKKNIKILNQKNSSFKEKHKRQLIQKQKNIEQLNNQLKSNKIQSNNNKQQIQKAQIYANNYFIQKNDFYKKISQIDSKRMKLLQNQQLDQNQFNSLGKQKQKYLQNLKQAEQKLLKKDKQKDDLTSKNHELRQRRWNIQNILQELKNIQQKQQLQIKQCRYQIQNSQKELRKKEGSVQIQKQQFRKKIVWSRKQQLIAQKKKQFQSNAMLKLKQKTHIPKDNDKFMFTKQFFAGFQNKIAAANSNYYVRMIQSIIQNTFRAIDNMQDFMICELMIFYLSMINYQTYSQNVISYLERMDYLRKKYNKVENEDEIAYKQKQIKYYQQRLEQYKQKKKKTTLSALQTKNVILMQKKIAQLKKNYNQNRQNNLIFSFFKAFQRIKNIISIIADQHVYHFIQILMGFFQCRIIKNSNILWMIQNQYVIVKSSSIIVAQCMKSKQEKFCYYFDNEQETVLMKFNDAYSLIKAFINQKHNNFMKRYNYLIYKFINIDQNKKQQFIAREGMGLRPKNKNLNQDLFNLSKFQENAQDNFQVFLSNQTPKQLIQYKDKLLKFYFQNGHKNHECFHLVYHQLKQINEMKKIFQKMDYFNNQMIISMRKRFDNLKNHLEKWEFVSKQRDLVVACKNE